MHGRITAMGDRNVVGVPIDAVVRVTVPNGTIRPVATGTLPIAVAAPSTPTSSGRIAGPVPCRTTVRSTTLIRMRIWWCCRVVQLRQLTLATTVIDLLPIVVTSRTAAATHADEYLVGADQGEWGLRERFALSDYQHHCKQH